LDLLLTDVVMPMMSGKELAGRMQERQPDLKVLFMSGYTQDMILHQGVPDPDVCLIVKPFSARLLLQRVEEILTGG